MSIKLATNVHIRNRLGICRRRGSRLIAMVTMNIRFAYSACLVETRLMSPFMQGSKTPDGTKDEQMSDICKANHVRALHVTGTSTASGVDHAVDRWDLASQIPRTRRGALCSSRYVARRHLIQLFCMAKVSKLPFGR
jgi:hypothetical protein